MDKSIDKLIHALYTGSKGDFRKSFGEKLVTKLKRSVHGRYFLSSLGMLLFLLA